MQRDEVPRQHPGTCRRTAHQQQPGRPPKTADIVKINTDTHHRQKQKITTEIKILITYIKQTLEIDILPPELTRSSQFLHADTETLASTNTNGTLPRPWKAATVTAGEHPNLLYRDKIK